MLYRFDRFELDTAKAELRSAGDVLPIEPQVFALLAVLVEHRERLVSKDEIIEKVWDGRIVSESAVSSRIKSARQALGDDGRAQRFIRTLHRQGFRFVAETTVVRPSLPERTPAEAPIITSARPSIAITSFRLVGDAGPLAPIAEALPHELITELARLRWLFVTARGSSFRVSTADTDVREIGRLLGVTYCLSGTVDVAGTRLTVTVELHDTRNGGVVWADSYSTSIDDVHAVRAEIRAGVLAALDVRIPLHEAEVARLGGTEHLDAWAAYHLGLQHLYRFNRKDSAAAARLFERAIERDPGFARAHAGLSFVHFQTAFLHHTDERAREIALARACAERGLELDPVDPFVNFTMGRSFWLEGELDSSLPWLDRAITLCPNYAQGIYARAWTEALTHHGPDSREHVDLAMRLSPLDPMYYAMLGTRAFAHMDMGDDVEAVTWAERAARSPGAHVLIAMIAAAAHALGGDAQRAGAWAANVRERNPALTRADFFSAFPMKSEAMRARISRALSQLGF